MLCHPSETYQTWEHSVINFFIFLHLCLGNGWILITIQRIHEEVNAAVVLGSIMSWLAAKGLEAIQRQKLPHYTSLLSSHIMANFWSLALAHETHFANAALVSHKCNKGLTSKSPLSSCDLHIFAFATCDRLKHTEVNYVAVPGTSIDSKMSFIDAVCHK